MRLISNKTMIITMAIWLSSPLAVRAEETKQTYLPVTTMTESSVKQLDAKVTSNMAVGYLSTDNTKIAQSVPSGVQSPAGSQAAQQPVDACPRIPGNDLRSYAMHEKSLNNQGEGVQRTISRIDVDSTITNVNPFHSLWWVSITDSLGCRFELSQENQTAALRLAESLYSATFNPQAKFNFVVTACVNQNNYCVAQLANGGFEIQ